ncbi:MAG: sulfite exporter TauE/SafE family protein [Clostridia bacterium]|nr:sulfite exporter TauE/SafE family protein [Clostridia bacterium]
MIENEILKYKEESAQQKRKRITFLILGGIFIGFVNGFFGAGGGMLAVPLLCFVAGLNEKQAHATAIAVILPLSIVSAIVYVRNGALDASIFSPVLLGTIIGGIAGAVLLSKLNNKVLVLIFYLVMVIAGIRLII